MEYTLRPYQEDAAAKVVKGVREGMANPGEAVTTLSAPTGAGKTIIAAAAIEELLIADPELAILWVSMMPELNQQTADKFERASDFLRSRLAIIDADPRYDVPVLPGGQVYFLNPQKLGRGATSYRAGDRREHDLWDTLNNTVRMLGGRLVVFIDEAHYGTGRNANGDGTYLSQFLNGTGRGKRPAPVVVGISATPDRFDKALMGRESKRYVSVDINDVRLSGLVKDHLLLAHPTEEIAADVTLLQEATRQRSRMAKLWQAYADENDAPSVEPILMVQLPASVQDRTAADWIDAIREADATLTEHEVVHALESHGVETFGSHNVRWLEPSRIQESPSVRVVLFKEALTTGWDCPRAEVLISLRRSSDDVTITQLIGRAVRTPLAQRVVGDDELNSVRVYLPHFDEQSVSRVIQRLRDGDDAIATDTIANPVSLVRNPAVPSEVWDAFRDFPTWTRPVKTARNTTARLLSAGMVLAQHEIVPDALTRAQSRIVDVLLSHRAAHHGYIDEKVKAFEEVDFITRSIDWLGGQEIGAADSSLAIATRNIIDLYKIAKRRMPDASAEWLWKRVVANGEDPSLARLVVAAIAQQPDTNTVVEDAARSMLGTWKQEHLAALARIGGNAQEEFLSVFTESSRSEEIAIVEPQPTSVAWSTVTWEKHLLAADVGQQTPAGLYPFDPKNSWELRVLNAEVKRSDTIGWYRNPTGGRSAVAVPYGNIGAQRVLYPDFLIFTRGADGSIQTAIVDPHRPDLGDTIEKWSALGEFAAAHPERIVRAWAVISGNGDELLFLDLASNAGRVALQQAGASGGGEQAIRAAFSSTGGRYS